MDDTVLESGWINDILFGEYLEYLWSCLKTKPTADRPFIFLMDGHVTRLNYKNMRWLADHHFKLIVFPPNATPYIQPLDAHGGPFQVLKVQATIQLVYDDVDDVDD
jgi:DDE superfamily endonuclease